MCIYTYLNTISYIINSQILPNTLNHLIKHNKVQISVCKYHIFKAVINNVQRFNLNAILRGTHITRDALNFNICNF